MPVNFDSIQPVASAKVTTSSRIALLRIEFARALDQDTLADMQGLESQPFASYLFYYPIKRMFDVNVNSAYSLKEIAEQIARMIEGHGLSVQRQVELSDGELVSSFTPQ